MPRSCSSLGSRGRAGLPAKRRRLRWRRGPRGAQGPVRELEAKRKELYARFPSANGDLHMGTITSDGAALITFAKAAGEVPVHPPDTAGQRLIEYLLRQEVANAA